MQQRDHYFAGLDMVRLLAIILVTLQHVFTLLNRDSWTVVAGLSIGQVGVAWFLVVSGLLASESRRPPVEWLFQRFRRVYPTYWIVMVVSFLLAAVVGHKSFGVGQVVAQFVGIGLFTHRDNLINTPTWFITLLLVCYFGTFVGRLLLAPWLIGVGATLVLAVVVGLTPDPLLLSHFFTYALANTLALAPRKYRAILAWLLAGVCLGLAFWIEWAYAYAAVALIVIELARLIHTVPSWIRGLASYSYEYYLIHGVVLYGFIQQLPSAPVVAVGGAILVSAVGAYALHHLVAFLEKYLFPPKPVMTPR